MIHRRLDRGAAHVEIGECYLDDASCFVLEDAYQLLDAHERRRAEAFVFERDRDRYIRAHGFMRSRLAAFVGVPAENLVIVAEAGGKPYLAGHGDVDFNLSHSGAYAVLAMTRGQAVGIDIEAVHKSLGDDPGDLFEACLVADERDALNNLSASEQRRRFLSYWTAKEARMKMTGEGLTLEPTEIALKLIEGWAAGYRQPIAPAAELRFVPLSWPDAICCLATGGASVRRAETGQAA